MNKLTKKRSRVRFAKDDDPTDKIGWAITTTRVWDKPPQRLLKSLHRIAHRLIIKSSK